MFQTKPSYTTRSIHDYEVQDGEYLGIDIHSFTKDET